MLDIHTSVRIALAGASRSYRLSLLLVFALLSEPSGTEGVAGYSGCPVRVGRDIVRDVFGFDAVKAFEES
jgi:hypothetical protein